MQIKSNMMSQISTNPTNYAKSKESSHTESNANSQNIQNGKDSQIDTQKDSANAKNEPKLDKIISNDTDNIGKIEQTQEYESLHKIELLEGNKNRITYGLKVIELMSDEEYQAFLWATQDLSESEKILMAQSLYRFTAFYQGKDSKKENMETDMQKTNAHKAFGVEHSMIDDFIRRYKNAYDKLMQSQFNTNGLTT